MRHPHPAPPPHPSRPPRHPRPGPRLERWHRRALYAVFGWLLASGVLWLVARYLLPAPAGEFGETVHPLLPWSMKLHGAGAMAALFLVGSLLNEHIRRAHQMRRNRRSGWALIALLLALTVSGYGLYYLAGEHSRPLWSAVHWIIGLLLPGMLALHVVLGRKAVRQPPR